MEKLQQYFTKQIEKHTEVKFNIFSALHNPNDEVRLHSRFIAYLLNSDSHHGMGNKFLKSFVQTVLEINDFDCENCTVRTEYKDIDILIYNDKQAIIIENKIFGGDSNHLHREDEYSGQLERYYNTIKKGVDKDGKKSDVNREKIFMTYLTLNGRIPSPESRGKTLTIDEIICIDYTEKISKWLLDCISIAEEKDHLLAQNIHQYQELIIKLTSDVNQARESQKMISENIDEAWGLEKKDHFFTEECKDVFKHVKWHTVADFINELSELIEKSAEIIEKPSLKKITNVTHQPNNKSTTEILIRFKYNDVDLYIANDKKNGFTLGNLNIGKWDYFSDDIKDIKFSDFSKEQTFKMINCTKRKEVINKIVEFVDENYLKVNKTFPSK